ncbi:MAG: S9 family peptidase [Alphaproteobacteria bacterium]|nr:S9 family peptidase [Alphaproteobacteria bacterium]
MLRLAHAIVLLAACTPKTAPESAPADPALPPDLAAREDVVDTLHGVDVADPYRWLEDAEAEPVVAWTEARNAAFAAYTEAMPIRPWLYDRFQHLWRYDDESTPEPCLLSDRVIYKTKAADQDKWVVHMRASADAEGRVVLDPNTWGETETLGFFTASPDCRYAAYGVADAGNEDPVLHVLDLDTLEVLPDKVRGWKQSWVSWRHDNAGFYYTAKPLEGEVPEGEHFYWHRAWYHTLGAEAEADALVFADDQEKETYNGAWLSEDGRWLMRGRFKFSKNALWIEDLQGDAGPVPLTTEMDAEYWAEVVDDTLVIKTDWDAPNYRVMVTTTDKPGREHWAELIPESDAVIDGISLVGGHLYVSYQDKAATRIAVHTLDGAHLHDIELPTVGSAGVWGHWSKPEVWLWFASFAFPSTVYTYDVEANATTLYKESPIDIDPSNLEVEQVFYPSKDGTEVSMFLIRDKAAPKDGSVPFLLTGYGGFNVSLTPSFSTLYAVWVEAGGAVAIPNLRGGGEYGRAWHEAGMREKKQNVFDDFIAAGEWLIDQGWTTADTLAISGGSNGGLLVSAVVTQRPDLFEAVLCQVPLTDMVRFHRFGLANIWSEEYGNADDPELFPVLYGYSPYHSVVEGTDYPAILVTGSANDARTDPAHARKFAAAVRWADADHGLEEPILLSIQGASGHGGGVTIDTRADQYSRNYGFLMQQLGMTPPED